MTVMDALTKAMADLNLKSKDIVQFDGRVPDKALVHYVIPKYPIKQLSKFHVLDAATFYVPDRDIYLYMYPLSVETEILSRFLTEQPMSNVEAIYELSNGLDMEHTQTRDAFRSVVHDIFQSYSWTNEQGVDGGIDAFPPIYNYHHVDALHTMKRIAEELRSKRSALISDGRYAALKTRISLAFVTNAKLDDEMPDSLFYTDEIADRFRIAMDRYTVIMQREVNLIKLYHRVKAMRPGDKHIDEFLADVDAELDLGGVRLMFSYTGELLVSDARSAPDQAGKSTLFVKRTYPVREDATQARPQSREIDLLALISPSKSRRSYLLELMSIRSGLYSTERISYAISDAPAFIRAVSRAKFIPRSPQVTVVRDKLGIMDAMERTLRKLIADDSLLVLDLDETAYLQELALGVRLSKEEIATATGGAVGDDGIVTHHTLSLGSAVITGGALSSIMYPYSRKVGTLGEGECPAVDDIDILVFDKSYERTAERFDALVDAMVADMRERAEVTVVDRGSDRVRLLAVRSGKTHKLDIFRDKHPSCIGYASTIQGFHLSWVRGWYDGQNVKFLSSLIHRRSPMRPNTTAVDAEALIAKYEARGFKWNPSIIVISAEELRDEYLHMCELFSDFFSKGYKFPKEFVAPRP